MVWYAHVTVNYLLDNTAVIIGVVVSGAGALVIAVVVLILLGLLRSHKRKRIRLEMPDFTNIMFTPGYSIISS